MSEQTVYKELLRDYRELQLRVTQFSKVEQQLKSTKDRLDQELLIYKRISEFNSRALTTTDIPEFLNTVAESIVGIFELESAVVLVSRTQDGGAPQWMTATEGFAVNEQGVAGLLADLGRMTSLREEGPYVLRELSDLMVLHSQDAMLYVALLGDELRMWVCGMISKSNRPLYPELKPRHQTIFSVFAQQARTHLANLIQAEELQQKNDALLKSNSQLDQFVYSVSHDLRSPLLAIKGIIHLVLESEDPSEAITRYLSMAEQSIGRMDANIQEILEFSRQARMETELEEVDVPQLITTICDDLQFSDEREVRFDLQSNGISKLMTDRIRLTTILKNVIGNAVKYSKPEVLNPEVRVALASEPGYVRLEVADQGIGINEVAQHRVFDMFYRGTSRSIGTGLGLYICAELLAKMEGSISVESTEGEGSTFTILIPQPTTPN